VTPLPVMNDGVVYKDEEITVVVTEKSEHGLPVL
jgi:hypothetical protein